MKIITPDAGTFAFTSNSISASHCGYKGEVCFYRTISLDDPHEALTFVVFVYDNTPNKGKYGVSCIYHFSPDNVSKYVWYSCAYSKDKPWAFDSIDEALHSFFDIELFKYGSIGVVDNASEIATDPFGPVNYEKLATFWAHILKDIIRNRYSVPLVPHP